MYDWAWPWSIGRAGPGLPCQPHRGAGALSGCLGSDNGVSVNPKGNTGTGRESTGRVLNPPLSPLLASSSCPPVLSP